jgi:hypothetical protein
VESQLSKEAGRHQAYLEPSLEADSSSRSQPEVVGVRDPLDPKPNACRHPNVWRLRAAHAECRRAEGSRGPAATPAAAAKGISNKATPSEDAGPIRFTSAHGEVERCITQLDNPFTLNWVIDDLNKIQIASILCDCKAGKSYETYRLKIDWNMAMRVYSK